MSKTFATGVQNTLSTAVTGSVTKTQRDASTRPENHETSMMTWPSWDRVGGDVGLGRAHQRRRRGVAAGDLAGLSPMAVTGKTRDRWRAENDKPKLAPL